MENSASEAFLPGVPGEPAFPEYLQGLYKRLIAATVASNALPLGDDSEFYKSYGQVTQTLTGQQNALLSSLQSVLRGVQAEKADSVDMLVGAGHSDDDVDERFEKLVEAVDALLERIDTTVDNDIVGTAKSEAAAKMEDAARAAKPAAAAGAGTYSMVHAKNIVRPQLKWEHKVDNSNAPFVPPIIYKPNAIVPLEEVMSKFIGRQTEGEGEGVGSAVETHLRDALGIDHNAQPDDSCPHPYGPELEAFAPEESMLEAKEAWVYGTLDDTKLTYVDTPEALQDLRDTLNNCDDFAVDLEAHEYRSFSGFVCLMQISTRHEDFIVDTLELRSHMHILNEPFTNPKIVKVFHGADSDIIWLQRDFGIYVVNMFDTGQAARVLEFGRYSLAHLLNHYCQLTVDKKYQLADWRIRPLPADMLKYAREDTHYLLYVYDRLRAELKARGNANNNFLHAVWNRSTEICRRRFEKERWRPTSYLALFHKYSRTFNQTQLRVFQALYDWRDRCARLEDESVRYVLPNHMLFQTARLMPTDATGVLACCNPVPPLVRLHATGIATLIANAIKAEAEPRVGGEGEAEVEARTAAASASHRVVVSHHLYNPLGWQEDDQVPVVPLEERLQRCDAAPESKPSATARVLAANGANHKTKAARLAAKIMAAFTDIFAAYTAPATVPTASNTPKPSRESTPAPAPAPAPTSTKEPAPTDAVAPAAKPKSEVVVLSSLGRKRPASQSASPAPGPAPANTKRARVAAATPASDFVPFDYTQAAVKDEKPPAAAEGPDARTAKKGGPKKGGGFNPYASLQEAQFKKQPTANVTPKSGQRTMTYSYTTDNKKSGGKPKRK